MKKLEDKKKKENNRKHEKAEEKTKEKIKKETETKISAKAIAKILKPEAQIPQISEASFSKEDSTPVLKSKQNTPQNLEDSLQDVEIQKNTKKEEEKQKYVQADYKDLPKRYARAESTENIENMETRTVNSLKATVLPKTIQETHVKWVPKQEQPVQIIKRETLQFSEEIIKYKNEDNKDNLPNSKWYDPQKRVKKYKIQVA